MSFIKNSAEKEKDKLLQALRFATNLLTVKGQLFTAEKLRSKEDYVLKSVLDECLNLLNEELGYFAICKVKSMENKILFASKAYTHQIGKKYPISEGMLGKAIKTRSPVIMNNRTDTPEYINFDDSNIDKNVKSAVAIPAIFGDHVLGVYMIESEHENCFTDTEIDILKALVSQALAAITNIRQVQEIELGKTLFENLIHIDKTLVDKSFELKDILDVILKKCLNIVTSQNGKILLKINENELRIVASTQPRFLDRKVEINASISGLAVIEKKEKYFPDLSIAEEKYAHLYKNVFGGDNLICQLAVPLIVHNEVFGVFNTESNQANRFTQAYIDRVKGFAGQAALAIYNYKLFEDAKKFRSRLEALAEIDLLILNSNQSLPETLGAILKRGLSLIKKDHGEIALLETGQNREEELVIKKSTTPYGEGRKFSPKSTLSSLAIEKRVIIYVPFLDKKESTIKVTDNSLYIPSPNETQLYKTSSWRNMKSVLVLPLIIKDKVIGVFNIESPKYSDFHQDDINLFKNLALAAAIAIHNAQLFEEINEKSRKLEGSVDKATIELSTILGKVINHRIGNSVGTIRAILKDKLLYGDYGKFNKNIIQEFNVMLACAEKVIGARKEISEKMEQLLFAKPSPIDFKAVRKTIEANEEFNSYAKVKIEIKGFEELNPVLFNMDLFLEGIVFELIRNGIKSMPNGGKLTIIGKTEDNFNLISFADTGCGIEESAKEKVFYEGYSKWSKGKGSGIGLYELRTILEFFRGSIEIDSKQGEGSTFTVKLPIAEINN